MWKGVERAEAAVPAERSPTKVLGELLRGEWLAFSAKSVRKWLTVDEARVLERNVRTVFAESGFKIGGSCSSLHDCNGGLSLPRAWWTEGCVLHHSNLWAGQKLRAQEKFVEQFCDYPGEGRPEGKSVS